MEYEEKNSLNSRTLRPHRLHEAIPEPSGRTTECGRPTFVVFENSFCPRPRSRFRAEGRCSDANLAALPRSLGTLHCAELVNHASNFFTRVHRLFRQAVRKGPQSSSFCSKRAKVWHRSTDAFGDFVLMFFLTGSNVPSSNNDYAVLSRCLLVQSRITFGSQGTEHACLRGRNIHWDRVHTQYRLAVK